MNRQQNFWQYGADDVLKGLTTNTNGLSQQEASARLKQFGPNSLASRQKLNTFILLLKQFTSPIILILIAAAILSVSLSDATDAIIILSIILVSGLLGFFQEKGASDAVAKLREIIQIKANVLRGGNEQEINAIDIVPGDIIILNAGDSIPGDCLLLEGNSLFVDEASLTGESFPVEKEPGISPADSPISQRKNALFMGTNVRSGMGKAVVVYTGNETLFGGISKNVQSHTVSNQFETGIRRFGYLLIQITLILVLSIFAINIFFHKDPIESLLFSLALAVGLTPQLLPAIISINLASGTKRLAKQKVIVKKLESIEDFGSMNVLCSDKTGTLTEGTVDIEGFRDFEGSDYQKLKIYSYLNGFFETGFNNPIDEALRSIKDVDASAFKKVQEIPYDFQRKRLSMVVRQENQNFIISKGALKNILDVCTQAEKANGEKVDINTAQDKIQEAFQKYSEQGCRVIGVAYKESGKEKISVADEKDMIFLGFMTITDPLKISSLDAINSLNSLGVNLKIITGDNRLIAAGIARKLKLDESAIMTGPEINSISNEALLHRINKISVFAEVEPNQKEKIIIFLKRAGNVVGYMGDGINDASALHAADVGISVNDAVDVAKEAADIVLMEKDLNVLINGVKEGRVTFANTLKYIFMATSANFGNMFSMAGASLLLPFLPLLPKQILLINLLTDLPGMTLSKDNVDDEMINQPRRWDIKFIRRFMLVFGLCSSVFDYLTFGTLRFLLHADTKQFQTGWFIESVLSASLIVLVIRTRRSALASRPGKYLVLATLLVCTITIIIPYTKLGDLMGFEPLKPIFFAVVAAILVMYMVSAELIKRLFYKGKGN